MAQNFQVTAWWDDEARVWVATSEDIVGLATEAPTLDQLLERIVAVAPELLDGNGVALAGRDMVDIQIVSDLLPWPANGCPPPHRRVASPLGPASGPSGKTPRAGFR